MTNMIVLKFPLLEYLKYLRQILYQNSPRNTNNKKNYWFISSMLRIHPWKISVKLLFVGLPKNKMISLHLLAIKTSFKTQWSYS